MKKMVMVLLLTAAMIITSIDVMAGSKKPNVAQLFQKKCSACHSDKMPLHIKKDRKAWEATVKEMQAKRPKWINNQEANAIVNYLVNHSKNQKKGL